MPTIQTVRFGEFTYRTENVIHLPEGLVGMPDLRDWLVLDMGKDIPMKWFQSLDRGDFGFPVSQPAFFTDSYDISIPEAAKPTLRGRPGEWLAILIITTVHPGGTHISGNLLAPLVINVDTRVGVQLVQDNPQWGIRQEINYLKFGLAVDGMSAENDLVPEGTEDGGEDFLQELLDSSPDSGQSEIRPEVETPEPAGV